MQFKMIMKEVGGMVLNNNFSQNLSSHALFMGFYCVTLAVVFFFIFSKSY